MSFAGYVVIRPAVGHGGGVGERRDSGLRSFPNVDMSILDTTMLVSSQLIRSTGFGSAERLTGNWLRRFLVRTLLHNWSGIQMGHQVVTSGDVQW